MFCYHEENLVLVFLFCSSIVNLQYTLMHFTITWSRFELCMLTVIFCVNECFLLWGIEVQIVLIDYNFRIELIRRRCTICLILLMKLLCLQLEFELFYNSRICKLSCTLLRLEFANNSDIISELANGDAPFNIEFEVSAFIRVADRIKQMIEYEPRSIESRKSIFWPDSVCLKRKTNSLWSQNILPSGPACNKASKLFDKWCICNDFLSLNNTIESDK